VEKDREVAVSVLNSSLLLNQVNNTMYDSLRQNREDRLGTLGKLSPRKRKNLIQATLNETDA
jgi:hypothetical protein